LFFTLYKTVILNKYQYVHNLNLKCTHSI